MYCYQNKIALQFYSFAITEYHTEASFASLSFADIYILFYRKDIILQYCTIMFAMPIFDFMFNVK